MTPLIRRSQFAVPRHAGEDGAPVNGLPPSGSPPIGSVNLMPSAAIPMRCVPACLSTSRCAGTASPRSSAGRPRSCSPAASHITGAMIPVDGGAISSI